MPAWFSGDTSKFRAFGTFTVARRLIIGEPSRRADVVMHAHLRIARPVADLARTERMYRDAFELSVLARFDDHDGFSGVMLGREGLDYHFEFTHCPAHPVAPSPTPEDLIVFYLPDHGAWEAACARAAAHGFMRVASFNPYWDACGQTFEDPDGYRIVLQNAEWR
nr:VOC family protein [Burkholderia ambifaria]